MKLAKHRNLSDYPQALKGPGEKTGLECCLDTAARSQAGIGWTIPKEWVDQLVVKYDLHPEQRNGDMSGEFSALFQHNGETLRLKLSFPGRWQVFHGDWKPDPRWTGD